MKKIFTLLVLSSTLVYCGQTKTEKQVDIDVTHNQHEKKYNRVISDSTNKLSGKIENLEVEYKVFGCACANWIRTTDLNTKDSSKKFKDLYFFIEPANSHVALPVYFDAFRHYLNIKGQFYVREDYPQGTLEMEEPLAKAKVFRYTELEVLDKPNFKPDTKIETLNLRYNAISCTCAQWSDIKLQKDPDQRIYYWLEPANDTLINADSLFNGEDLPVEVKVTGQIISQNGFPKSKHLSKAGQNEAGKVFRYTKIKIVKTGWKNSDH